MPKIQYIRTVLIYVVFIILMIVVLSLKRDFFVDELLTYNLANGKGWFEPAQSVEYVPAATPFVEAFSSTGDFDINVVWYRQEGDVHPPFYYLLVHIISCLNPGSVSIYIAGSINVVFMILTLYIIRKLVDELISNKHAKDIISITFIASACFLSMSSFLRMYCMVMFCVTTLSYILVKNIEHYSIYSFLFLLIITVIGALTHYYYILYAFFICMTVGIMLLIDKRWKEVVGLIVTMASAGLISYLIFPAMVDHIFHSYRGTESIDNLANSDFADRIKDFWLSTSRQLYGGLLEEILLLIIVLLVVRRVKCGKSKLEEGHCLEKKYCMLGVPTALFFVTISKSAPILSIRYLSPVFAVALVLVLAALYYMISLTINSLAYQLCIFAFICAIVTLGSYINCDWEYLYRNHDEAMTYAEQNATNTKAICVYNDSWRIVTSYYEMAQCSSSAFYQLSSYEEFENQNIKLPDELAFFLIGTDADFLDKFEYDHPEYKLVKDNGTFGYANVYYYSR